MDLFPTFFTGEFAVGPGGLTTVLLVLLTAFIVGHIVSWTYMWTHTGLSYSQTFTSSLLVQPVIVSMIMLLMAGNLLIALGVLTVFAMIRFRNVLKDTRDTTFILWAIVEGVAAGTQRYGVALLGAVLICLVFLYVRFTGFGGRHRYDVILSLEWAGQENYVAALRPIFTRHAVKAQLAGQHDLEANKMDLSYRLLLRDPARSRELLSDLETTAGVARVSLFHRSDEAEV